MDARVLVLTLSLVGAMTGVASAGQHDGHLAGGATPPSAAQVGECRQAQPVVTELLNTALKRLEEARLTNSAAAMRDAADDVQAALVDMRTQLAPCTVMQAADPAADPQAGHTMPSIPTPPASASPGAAADPHTSHEMPNLPPSTASLVPATPQRPAAGATDSHAGHMTPAVAAQPRSTPVGKPSASSAAAHDAHAERGAPAAQPKETAPAAADTASAPPPPTNIADLKCPNPFDARTAPRMLYQGRMYYFCTEVSRAEFANDPAKFVTAPPQAAPAHAH